MYYCASTSHDTIRDMSVMRGKSSALLLAHVTPEAVSSNAPMSSTLLALSTNSSVSLLEQLNFFSQQLGIKHLNSHHRLFPLHFSLQFTYVWAASKNKSSLWPAFGLAASFNGNFAPASYWRRVRILRPTP